MEGERERGIDGRGEGHEADDRPPRVGGGGGGGDGPGQEARDGLACVDGAVVLADCRTREAKTVFSETHLAKTRTLPTRDVNPSSRHTELGAVEIGGERGEERVDLAPRHEEARTRGAASHC